jgi:hypothetical protein
MSKFDADVLVTDRRRSSRRRTAPERKSIVSQVELAPAKVERRKTPVAAEPEVAPKSAHDAALELAIAERREIIDRRRQDRRRQIDPTTCERDYSDGEIEFMRAMDDYKRKSGRPFPTWSEVLEVVMSLGYRKVADPSTLEWRTFGDTVGSL